MILTTIKSIVQVMFFITLLGLSAGMLIAFMFIFLLIVVFIRSMRFKKHYAAHQLRDIRDCFFMPYCKLPKDINLFKHMYRQSLYNATLPKINLNDYDFENVSIAGCNFNKNTILPTDTEFFQKIADKDISDCKLPIGDYSNFNFTGVNLARVTFRKGSQLPKQYDLFSSSKYSHCIQISLPKECAEELYLYNLQGVGLYILNKVKLSNRAKYLMYNIHRRTII